MDTACWSYSDDGLECIITNPNTPMPWVNVISNGDYGLVISQTPAAVTAGEPTPV